MPKAEQIYHKRPDILKGICYAQACKAGNMLFISGCVSWDSEGNIIGAGDMKAQVTQVYTDLKETLETNGATFQNVITRIGLLDARGALRRCGYGALQPPICSARAKGPTRSNLSVVKDITKT